MPKKQSRTEISTLEVSMIEEEGTFMTMRSSKRKYPTPTSYEAPVGLPGPSGSHGALPKAAGRLRHEMRRYDVLHDKVRLPGPSGSHGAYYKGRPRSYNPYGDEDAYLVYDEMVAERKAQGREVEGKYRQNFQANHEGLEPSDDECERYDPEEYDEQCDEYGDQCGDPEITWKEQEFVKQEMQ